MPAEMTSIFTATSEAFVRRVKPGEVSDIRDSNGKIIVQIIGTEEGFDYKSLPDELTTHYTETPGKDGYSQSTVLPPLIVRAIRSF